MIQKNLSENEVLERIARRVRIPAGSLVRTGIGDDCAIVRQRGSTEDLVFTTDLFIEEVHFRRETHRPEDCGHKALARGLSDIASMGAEPRFCLLSIALARWVTARWLDRFYDGLLALAWRYAVVLAGGDLGHAEVLACDIVVCGSTPRGKALLRSGAKPGDAIYVSGELGGSAHGLASRKGKAWKRHLRPEPRVELGRFLRGKASACMDLSDGLSTDLARLCAASGVAAEIAAPPVFTSASLEEALHGGEDYELLFTAPQRIAIPSAFSGVRLTQIGQVVAKEPGTIALGEKPLAAGGYDHMRFR